MATSKIPPKGDDSVTLTTTKDVTGKELLGTMPVGGPADVSKDILSAEHSGGQYVRQDRPAELDPKPFDVGQASLSAATEDQKRQADLDPKNRYDAGTVSNVAAQNKAASVNPNASFGSDPSSLRDQLTVNDLHASAAHGSQPDNGEFFQVLDIDSKWGVRVNGITVLLEPKSDFAGLPVPGLLQRIASVVNGAMAQGRTSGSTMADSPTIQRLDAVQRSERQVAEQKLAMEDGGLTK